MLCCSGGEMPVWFHPDCLFSNMRRGRVGNSPYQIVIVDGFHAGGAKINSDADIEGFADLNKKDQQSLLSKVNKDVTAKADLANADCTYLEFRGDEQKA